MDAALRRLSSLRGSPPPVPGRGHGYSSRGNRLGSVFPADRARRLRAGGGSGDGPGFRGVAGSLRLSRSVARRVHGSRGGFAPPGACGSALRKVRGPPGFVSGPPGAVRGRHGPAPEPGQPARRKRGASVSRSGRFRPADRRHSRRIGNTERRGSGAGSRQRVHLDAGRRVGPGALQRIAWRAVARSFERGPRAHGCARSSGGLSRPHGPRAGGRSPGVRNRDGVVPSRKTRRPARALRPGMDRRTGMARAHPFRSREAGSVPSPASPRLRYAGEIDDSGTLPVGSAPAIGLPPAPGSVPGGGGARGFRGRTEGGRLASRPRAAGFRPGGRSLAGQLGWRGHRRVHRRSRARRHHWTHGFLRADWPA